MTPLTEDDKKDALTNLLKLVSQRGLKALNEEQLLRLYFLLENKNYEDKKANKSKKNLLKKINAAIYDINS